MSKGTMASRFEGLRPMMSRGAWRRRDLDPTLRLLGQASDEHRETVEVEDFPVKDAGKIVFGKDYLYNELMECFFYGGHVASPLWNAEISPGRKPFVGPTYLVATSSGNRERAKLEARLRTVEAELARLKAREIATKPADSSIPGRKSIQLVKQMTREVFGDEVKAVFREADESDEAHWTVTAYLSKGTDRAVAKQKISDWHDRLIDVALDVGGGAVRLDLRYQ